MKAVKASAGLALEGGVCGNVSALLGEFICVDWVGEVEAQLKWFLTFGDSVLVDGEMVDYVTSALFVAHCVDWNRLSCRILRGEDESGWIRCMARVGEVFDERMYFIGTRWRGVMGSMAAVSSVVRAFDPHTLSGSTGQVLLLADAL